MILLLDIGNTNLKWAWLDGATLQPGGHAALNDISVEVIATSQWAALPKPERIVAASVAAEDALEQLARWADSHWGVHIERLHAERQAFGVTNGYTTPQQLGVDRWLALIAARRLTAAAVCVVDCGTAVTIDLLDADGRHRGGLITPGYELARKALLAGTRIPCDDPGTASEDGPLGTDTAGAVRNGWGYGLAALIARVTGGETPIILTGSGAKRLLPLLHQPVNYQPDLVFQGLAMVGGAGNRP